MPASTCLNTLFAKLSVNFVFLVTSENMSPCFAAGAQLQAVGHAHLISELEHGPVAIVVHELVQQPRDRSRASVMPPACRRASSRRSAHHSRLVEWILRRHEVGGW